MADEEKDVKQEEELETSTDSEEVSEEAPETEDSVNESADSEQQEEETPKEASETLLYDESGVPWKNRAMEQERKRKEITEKIPDIVKEELQKARQQQGYSLDQLNQFSEQYPEAQPWVEQQKEEIRRKRTKQDMQEVLAEKERKEQQRVQKQQSLNYVVQSYPDMFKVDNGKAVAWKKDHPMYQTMSGLMKNPKFANDPEGLAAASDIAYGRYVRNNPKKETPKEKKMKRATKKLQKNSLPEGGGKEVAESSPAKKALDKVKQTGSKKDARAAVRQILQQQGQIEE